MSFLLHTCGILEGEGETRSSDRARRAPLPYSVPVYGVRALRGVKPCSAAHNAVGLAGESPVVGIDCLPT